MDIFFGTLAQLQNFIITNPAMIVISPTAIDRTVAPGQTLAADTFTVAHDTSVVRNLLSYTISDNASWLSVSPTSGTSSGAANTHTITYDTSSLAIGHYT